LRYVGVGRRFLATMIDWLFALIWVIPLSQVTKIVTHDPGGATLTSYRFELTGWRFAAAALITLFYYVVLEGLLGATVGKFLLSIRVVREDGTKMGWGGSLTRNLLRVVDLFPFVIPYLLGSVMIWTGRSQKQRIGDRAAKTVVIRTGASADSPASIPPSPAVTDTGATTWGPPSLPPPPQAPDDPSTSDRPST
jgi:uncharacterized RDD family membrane protein YckC